MATYGQLNADNLTSSTGGVISPNITSLRNRIINGAMVIDQRNAGASLAITTNPQYSVDRWCGNVWSSATGRFSLQQSSTAPTGFTNSLLATVTTADSSPSTNYGYSLIQYIEGFNTSDLGFGTANAKTVTLSFWVQSSVTGNFPFILYNYTTSRAYGALYTISSANTWTQISITITGDTTGTWSATNSGSFVVCFGFGGGSGRTTSTGWQNITGNVQNVTGATSLIATNGATFYITGVQLEAGAQATSFDYRPYGTELALCQRYYAKTFSTGTVPANNTTTTGALRGTARIINTSGQLEPATNWRFPSTMRASPTVTLYSSGIGSTTAQWNNDGSTSYSANARVQFIGDSNADINNAGVVLTASTPWQIHATADAEL